MVWRSERKETFQVHCAREVHPCNCFEGFHPAGAACATLDHGIPRLIHCARHAAGESPSSSSVTPGWNPHDGQIS